MVVVWQMDGVAGHRQGRRKPSEGLTTMVTSSSALLLFALLLEQQRARRPVQILRESRSPRGSAPRKHKQHNHPVAGEKQQQHQSVAVALATRLASRRANGVDWVAPAFSPTGSARIALVFGSVKTSATCFRLQPATGPTPRLFEASSRRWPQVPPHPAISRNPPPAQATALPPAIGEPARLLEPTPHRRKATTIRLGVF